MAKITRFNGNLQAFASEATGQERTIFGVETQADDLTSQIGALFRRGWGIVSPTDSPKLQDFNALGYTTTQLLAYLHQVGVPEWNGNQDFYTGSATLHNGRIWIAQVNEPTDVPGTSAQWETLLNLSDASVAATPGQVVKRGETGSADEGTAKFKDPTDPEHPARKQELDTHIQSETAHMASAIVHNPAENSFDSTDVQGALNEASQKIDAQASDLQWLGTAVAETKTLMFDDPALYPPTDSTLFRYILLSEGLDGAGQYNDDILINETITGSGVERQVTAEINLPDSPLHGQIIHLINSERSHLRPSETAGVFEQDQMQRITGQFASRSLLTDSGIPGLEGVFTGSSYRTGSTGLNNFANTSPTTPLDEWKLDSANSPDARTSATTDGETRVKSVSAIYFLRVA